MAEDTVIVVGVTREDEYGNLWVTSKGGGNEVKVGVKRQQLHPLFEQGKAVMLHWETYKGKTYVADAKLVEGELPPPQKPYEAPVIITPAKSDRDSVIEAQVAIKSITELWAAGKLTAENPLVGALHIWLAEKLNPYMTPIPQPPEGRSEIEPTTDDLSWATIQPDVKNLWDNKIKGWYSTVSIMKTLESLGADVSSGKIKTVYESLEEDGKKGFVAQVKEAEKLGGKEES